MLTTKMFLLSTHFFLYQLEAYFNHTVKGYSKNCKTLNLKILIFLNQKIIYTFKEILCLKE